MKLNIQKWGNSAAVRFPSAVLAQLGAKVGDAFEVDVTANQAVFRLSRPRYKLADLLAECDAKAPLPDVQDWDEAKAVGQEVW